MVRAREDLSPEDQRRVDEVTRSGIHSVERKPFRPIYMMVMLLIVTTVLMGLAILLERLVVP
jgi:hypothetical protein